MGRMMKVCILSMLAVFGFLTLTSAPSEALFTKDYLIWDPDPNNSSGPFMDATLKTLGYCGDYTAGTATNLVNNYTPITDYAAIFICLGVSPNTYIWGNQTDDDSVDALIGNYLAFTNPPDTPHIYIEGGDFWCYDLGKPGFYPMFRVDSLNCTDGFHDLDINTGVSSTCMEGLSFNYVGENQYIDRLIKTSPPDTAVYLFENGADSVYFSAVGYRPTSRQYVSIASSFEFGGIESSSQAGVMDSIMGCFFERAPGSFAIDAAALRVVNPTTFSQPGVPLAPEIEVQNSGVASATFNVFCTINPGAYSSNVTIFNLPPGNITTQAFPDLWIPGASCTSYDVTMWVELVGDLNICNDSTSSSTLSWNNTTVFRSPYTFSTPTIDGILGSEWTDAGSLDVSDILDRAGTGAMNCNSAWMYVKNDNNNVYFAIDAPAEVSFDLSDAFQLFFDDNHNHVFDGSGNEGRTNLLALLPAPGSDEVRFTPYDACNGTEIITALQGNVDFTTGHLQYELQIPLNTGGLPEVINANPGDTVGMWINLADAGAFKSIGWWPTSSTFNFGASCPDANLMGDLILGDSALALDVSAISILAPPDNVCPDSCYDPQVVVENIGGAPATFDVTVSIGTFYDDTVFNVSISSFGQDTVTFATVCFPPDTGVYTMNVCTNLGGDVNPSNDCTSKPITADLSCLAYHDVGISFLDVLLPGACVDPGDSVYVSVVANNFGNFFTETFEVMAYTIPNSYNPPNVPIANLPPSTQSPFIFDPPWVIAPSDSGFYDVIVKAIMVPSDTFPSNDSLVLVDTVRVCVGVEENPEEASIPTSFILNQSHPNPTSGKTEIQYGLPLDTPVNLSVYDVTGRLVIVLANGRQEAGFHKAHWDGKDVHGRDVGTGVYFYRLRAGDFIATKKMVVLR
jgi:hypothetical protein